MIKAAIETVNPKKALALERLIALWALSESGMGGILHAMQIPFKGIVVNGLSVILITLLAYYSTSKFRDIIRAMVIVIIIKAMVSPHTPPTAYFAVAFQGFTGALIFRLLPDIRAGAFLLSVITFLESATQRLITLTIIFGRPFWESIDVFFDYILKEFGRTGDAGSTGASSWIILIYLGIYFSAGMLVGIFAGKFPEKVGNVRLDEIPAGEKRAGAEEPDRNMDWKPWWKRKKFRLVAVLILITMVLYLLSSKYDLSIGIYVFFRTLLVIGIWYLLLAPLLMRAFSRFLRKQEKRYAREIETTILYLPELRMIARKSWAQSAIRKGPGRVSFFLEILVARTLFQPENMREDRKSQ